MAGRRKSDDWTWEDDIAISKARQHQYGPNKTDKEIIEQFLELSQGQPTTAAVAETAVALNLSVNRVASAVKKFKAKEEAKVIRQKVVEEVYEDKIPLMKDIVGISLSKLKQFISAVEIENIETIQEAKALKDIACDLNSMLRLELGQSTENIAINAQAQYTIEHTQKLLADLRPKDPIFFAGLLDGPNANAGAVAAVGTACGGPEQALRPDQPLPPKTTS